MGIRETVNNIGYGLSKNKKYEQWSARQWVGWGSKLQSRYDKYRNAKTPDWYLALTANVWDTLSDKTKEYLNTFVTKTIKTFDDTFAKELLDKIVNAIIKNRTI